MRPLPIAAAVFVALSSLSGCKFIKTETSADTATASERAPVDAIAQLVGETYAPKLLPLISEKAQSIAGLRAAVSADLDQAGASFGNRGAGQGAAWNFAITGEGVVISANLTSRARKAELDTNGDGAADLTLQLGPVIAGTALRDVAPFYDFGTFRDQIEFAKLARDLNDQASAGLTLPEGDLVGKTLSFEGVMPLKSASDPFVVTTVKVEVRP